MSRFKSSLRTLFLLIGLFFLIMLPKLWKWNQGEIVEGKVISLQFQDKSIFNPTVLYEYEGTAYIYENAKDAGWRSYRLHQPVQLLIPREDPADATLYFFAHYWLHPSTYILYLLAAVSLLGLRNYFWQVVFYRWQ